ncbi:MAG: dienelactone hydrolase family protein [Rhizobiales bacterium]|nr:dienelactone hydrolase family protein [Hyphomicrobiales bacterium]
MDQKFIDLYDRYTHGQMKRRDFLERLAVLAGGTTAATALLSALQNDYAKAALVAEDDSRLHTEMVSFAAGDAKATGYLAKPANIDKAPGVIVIHENRGLNPHIKDVARRMALEGFVVLAPDYLSEFGGTPADEDQAREQIGQLKPESPIAVSRGALAYLAARSDVNGKVGAVGFCWGGGQVGALAVAEPNLAAGVVYYGRQPPADKVKDIEAPLLLNYAGIDENVNKGIAAFEEALKAHGKAYELFMYEGANHAFNNDTNAARYNKEAADLAWRRTVDFLKKNTP